MEDKLKNMSLNEIAREIQFDWKKVNYAAKPYLEAMGCIKDIKDKYGLDSGSSIVSYFLTNASTWKSEVAKAIKKELNLRLKKK